jgi:serine/threonine protein kinase
MLENTPPYKVIQKPKKISPDLVDFATQCTNVNMIKRPESNSLILHPFIGMARAGALNNFYTRETNLNISFLHLRSKSVAPQLVSGGSNSNPRGLSSSPSSETVCSRPTSISMLPSPSTSSPLSPAGGLSLQSYPTITQVPNPVGSSQGAQTPPQQQPAAGSNNDLIAIKGVFRRYREDIFQEKIPLDAAELMEKRLEELEADIMAILNRTPTQSDSPAAGVRRLPPNVNASSQ